MAKLNMTGPYELDKSAVDKEVSDTLPGNYALGSKNDKGIFLVGYVGRSDDNVNDRLQYWVNNSSEPFFKFLYASSAKAAYEKECQNYHDFDPPDNDIHPAKQNGKDWKCPVCGE